jgi:hypothetical protein
MYAYINPQNGEGNKDTKEEMPDAECFGLGGDGYRKVAGGSLAVSKVNGIGEMWSDFFLCVCMHVYEYDVCVFVCVCVYVYLCMGIYAIYIYIW